MDWNSQKTFNQKAEGWDDNPRRQAIANKAAKAILANTSLQGSMETLEFGCGTGLVTLSIAPHVGHLTAVDTSKGMLDVLAAKLSASGITTVTPLQINLASTEAAKGLDKRFDFIYGSMTLHHIAATGNFLKTLASLARPGAILAIADIDAEDGYFHDDPSEEVHHGFEREELSGMLEEAGFSTPHFSTVHSIEKVNRKGEQRAYPMFLAITTLVTDNH